MRPLPFVAGIGVLTAAWLGPLSALAQRMFAAHMVMHVAVIAIAAPLLAIAIAGSRRDPVRCMPAVFSPVPASVIELVVVWVWHAPALHHLARHGDAMQALEQGSFLLAGLLVWLAAFGGSHAQRADRAVASVTGLLLTSMHMTLLGVLLAVADRDLYGHAGAFGFDALQDQHLGGVIMLCVGGLAYLAGALYRVSGLLQETRDAVSTD
jgi:putative membrane protein